MKKKLALFTAFLCIGSTILAQNSTYKDRAVSALKKGDYLTAEKQYKAYAASLNVIGNQTDKQKLEKLDAEKALAKITECKPLAQSASAAYKTAMSQLEAYNAIGDGNSEALNTAYTKCKASLESAKRKYQAVKAKFPEDGLAGSRISSITNTLANLQSPAQKIEEYNRLKNTAIAASVNEASTKEESSADIRKKREIRLEDIPDKTEEIEAIPFQLVEEKPSFNGGDANEFSMWVNSQLVYPEIAKDNGVQGRVVLQFTVNADGSVSNVKVLRGVDSSLDKEAVRVVSASPKWKPGKQKGQYVKVTYTFPVIFQLK